MDTFRTTIEVSTFPETRKRVRLESVMIDPEPMFSWLPREVLADAGVEPAEIEQFETKDGRIIERRIGHARISAAGESAPTLVVFAEPGDRIVLGAHALSGMNLKVDPIAKRLIDAGPISAAVA
jgi:predicted aspartyl protease